MSFNARRQIRRQLERQLGTKPFRQKLATLRQEFPSFERFTLWSEIIDCLHDRWIGDTIKDDLLRVLLWVRQHEADAAWNVVLTVAFWPALDLIYRQKYTWDSDAEELWHNLYWVFLEVVEKINVLKRPDRLWSKVFNDTVHNLYHHYQTVWRRSKQEKILNAEKWSALEETVAGSGAWNITRNAEAGLALNRLKRLRRRGILVETEFKVLVATEIFGESVADFARDNDLSYQAVKKRRQRALAKIGRKKTEILCPRNRRIPPFRLVKGIMPSCRRE